MNLDFFRRRGYQILRGAIDPQAAASVHEFLAGEAGRAIDSLQTQFGCKDSLALCVRIDELYHSNNFMALDQASRNLMSGHYPLESRLSRILWQIPQQSTMRRVLQEVLGEEQLYLHMPPTARFILPGNSHAGVPAHQDVTYNKHLTNFSYVEVPIKAMERQAGGSSALKIRNVLSVVHTFLDLFIRRLARSPLFRPRTIPRRTAPPDQSTSVASGRDETAPKNTVETTNGGARI